jgi:hypothetical protein
MSDAVRAAVQNAMNKTAPKPGMLHFDYVLAIQGLRQVITALDKDDRDECLCAVLALSEMEAAIEGMRIEMFSGATTLAEIRKIVGQQHEQ